MGLGESASAFGRIIGPIGGTASYALYHGFPYLAGGLIMAVAAVLASRLASPNAPVAAPATAEDA
jgi:hypothetical protein